MSKTLYRVTPADLEIRGDGRTIAGIAVPFGEVAEVRDRIASYREVFRRGAFAKTIAERASRIKLLVNHDAMRRLPIGAATLLREDTSGLYGEFRVSKTRDGDEVLELVGDGVLDGFSVGFQPIKKRTATDGTIERLEVKLNEISATAFPAYSGAKVLAVRSDGIRHLPADLARRRLALLERTS